VEKKKKKPTSFPQPKKQKFEMSEDKIVETLEELKETSRRLDVSLAPEKEEIWQRFVDRSRSSLAVVQSQVISSRDSLKNALNAAKSEVEIAEHLLQCLAYSPQEPYTWKLRSFKPPSTYGEIEYDPVRKKRKKHTTFSKTRKTICKKLEEKR
jgi:hypothetical protein